MRKLTKAELRQLGFLKGYYSYGSVYPSPGTSPPIRRREAIEHTRKKNAQ